MRKTLINQAGDPYGTRTRVAGVDTQKPLESAEFGNFPPLFRRYGPRDTGLTAKLSRLCVAALGNQPDHYITNRKAPPAFPRQGQSRTGNGSGVTGVLLTMLDGLSQVLTGLAHFAARHFGVSVHRFHPCSKIRSMALGKANFFPRTLSQALSPPDNLGTNGMVYMVTGLGRWPVVTDPV